MATGADALAVVVVVGTAEREGDEVVADRGDGGAAWIAELAGWVTSKDAAAARLVSCRGCAAGSLCRPSALGVRIAVAHTVRDDGRAVDGAAEVTGAWHGVSVLRIT